jgi:hypothetical protein
VQVGKESAFLSIHEKGEREGQFFFHDEMEKIKKQWLRYGAPKPSDKVVGEIYDLMLEVPSKRASASRERRLGARSISQKSVLVS